MWDEKEQLLSYVSKARMKVPYMYINLKGLDINNVNIKLIPDFSQKAKGAYIKYYDCLHFYTEDIDKYPIDRLLDYISTENPKVIMLQDEVGAQIYNRLVSSYIIERNYIIDLGCGFSSKGKEYKSVQVDINDIPDIVNLLLTEEEYSIVYTRDMLIQQMLDRYKCGNSRFYAVFIGNKIVATCSTYGETDNMAIIGGVMVHKDYRNRGYAFDVESHLRDDLYSEGKSCVSFVRTDNNPSLKLHNKLGGTIVSTYWKFIRR